MLTLISLCFLAQSPTDEYRYDEVRDTSTTVVHYSGPQISDHSISYP
jgi:hypothetical protein